MASKRNQKYIQREISSSEINDGNFLSEGSRSIIQQISPASIYYTSEKELLIENNYARSFVINGYPSRVFINWMDDLYYSDRDMDVVSYIEPANERQALDELTQKITQYEAQYQTEVEKGSIKNTSILESKISALYQQRARIEQNLENMFHVATFSTMYDHDLKTLNKESQKLQSRLAGKKIGLMPLTLRQDDGFQSVSPYGDIKITDYYRNMNTSALATMFPFYNAEVNHSNGTFLCATPNNTPVILNLFDKKIFNNANLFISGASGSGKSYLTSLIILRSVLEGIRHAIIDPEDEYGLATEEVKGLSVDISPSSTSTMNPFDIDFEYIIDDYGNVLGKTVDIKGKASELLNLFRIMLPDLMTSDIETDISEVLLQMYYDFGFTNDPESLYEKVEDFNSDTGEIIQYKALKTMPRMTDFRNYLIAYNENEASSGLTVFIKALKMFTEDGVYGMFDCYSSVSSDLFDNAPIVRFVTKGIEDDILRPIGMHIVTSWCWNKFIKRDVENKKRIVSDETWMMLQSTIKGSEYTALFLEKCARRIRKYNGSLCCASQNFREFIARPEGQAILSNSSVRMFLNQTPEDIQEVGDKFILSDGEKAFLLSASQGEVLMKVGQESFIAGVFAFPFEHEIITKKYGNKENIG